ncbi:MAG TPA: ATP-dependent zinc metalloprotease FtsH [Bacteroidia bacterium]|jgi:cell division protease FtsH
MDQETSGGSNKGRRDEPEQQKWGGRPFSFYWIYLAIFILLILINYFARPAAAPKETTWQRFKQQMLLEKDVAKITVVNKELAQIYIKKDSLEEIQYKDVPKERWGNINPGPHYYFTIGSIEAFERRLEEAEIGLPESEQVEVTYIQKGNGWGTLISWFLPLILLGLFWFYIFRRMGSMTGKMGASVFDFGKSNPQMYEKGKLSPITFKDVAGYGEAKTEVMEIVEFLKQPQQFTKLGAKIPKGILLVGAPGTGKTLMAKAVAGEAGVPFFSLSGPEFVEMFVGVGASRVRDLFSKAKQKAPSIIFIDEIDTIGRMRGRALSMQTNDERESTLNQLLTELDGFDTNTGVIVIAATNRADILDPALLRPGRFDRHIQLDLPNKEERLAIFNVHLKPLKLDKAVEVDYLASQTPGFSGADIANICNEAALIAARKKKDVVETKDFFDAIDRVVAGLEKKTKFISPAEKKIIAYHEAGHAIVSWMLPHVDPLLKVSIIPRGKSLGGAWYLPEERQIITRAQFFDRMCAALGGRTAEEVVFNEVSSGALDDLEKVTKQAYMMVANLGLSDKIGNISFYDSSGVYENSFQKPYSEATAQMIDEEVRKLVEKAHEHTRRILRSNRVKLDQLAELLLKKEILYKNELESILGERDGKAENVAGKF